LVVSVVGVLLVLVAWWRGANQEALDSQVGWAALATAGFAVAAYASVSWVLHARFSIIRRRELLLPTDLPWTEPATADEDADGHDELLIGGVGFERYHRASCPMAQHKDWPAFDRRTALAEGRRPCGVCSP
jgi:hypothetical protein